MKARHVVTLALSALVCSAAMAAAWSTPSGVVPGAFSYANGGDVNGLYGDPTWSGASMLFTPTAFEASASNGSTDTATDTVSVDIHVVPGVEVAQILVTELGDWSIINEGEVLATSEITITDLDGGGSQSWSLTYDPAMPISEAGQGQWYSWGVVDITGLENFTVALTNTFEATAGANSSANIGKVLSATEFQIEIIPEPTTLLLLVAGLGLIRRR